MNPLGASTWIWTSPFGDESLELVVRAKQFGFDVLEIAVEDPDRITGSRLREAGEQAGVTFTVCGAFGPDRDLSHDDAAIRAIGIEYVKRCVDLAAELGAPHFVGPMYSAVGKTRLLDPLERGAQRALAVESLKVVADYAGERGIALGVEPLNRFETDLVNTAEQALELIDLVGAPSLGVLLDSFHMNIDEKSLGDAVRLVGEQAAAGPHVRERPRHARHRPRAVDRAVRRAARHRLRRPARHRVLHPGGQGDRQGREPVAPARRRARRARAPRRRLPA